MKIRINTNTRVSTTRYTSVTARKRPSRSPRPGASFGVRVGKTSVRRFF